MYINCEIQTPLVTKRCIKNPIINGCGIGLWCVMPLSTIFQLYQWWFKKWL